MYHSCSIMLGPAPSGRVSQQGPSFGWAWAMKGSHSGGKRLTPWPFLLPPSSVPSLYGHVLFLQLLYAGSRVSEAHQGSNPLDRYIFGQRERSLLCSDGPVFLSDQFSSLNSLFPFTYPFLGDLSPSVSILCSCLSVVYRCLL